MQSSAGSVALLALLILCTVGPRVLGADPAGAIKSGECPRRISWCDRPPPYNHNCSIDSDCPGQQKCCIEICNQECKDPVPVVTKPGMCPKDCIMCVQAEEDQCKNDCDCTGNEKCCYFKCGLKCKAPETVKPKPGMCPEDTIMCIQAEEDQCKNDGDCAGNEKCCYFRCGLKCKAPETEKPGECPVPVTKCLAPAPLPKCMQDSECPGSQKCCTPLCTRECTNITTEKPGECPVPVTLCAASGPPAPPPKCKQDSDCPGSEKCCTPVCTRECTNITTVSEKPGLCPSPPSYPTCRTFPNPPMNVCTADQQCPGDEKCCEYGCKLQCKKPLQDKVGSCPAFNRSICLFARPAPAECSSDSQCPGTQRCCCHGNCRMECAETVKPGTCPTKPRYCKLPLPTQQCEDDSDCRGKQKCCSHCGRKCIDLIGNPGFCPLDPEKEKQCGYLPPPRCSSDAQCKAGEKCCLFGCGVQCVKALPVKPGMCPAILAKCKLPLDKPECQDDGDCPLNRKCCQLCGNKCLEPETDHAGVCPSYIIKKPLICPAVLTFSCRHDWNCNADEKCCNVGCQRKCVKALPEKMGVCPKVPLVTNIEELCHKCNNDKDCPGIERCCAGPKGRQCQPPSKFVGLPIPVEEPDS